MESETENCSCYKKDPIFDIIFLFVQVAVLYKVWGMTGRRLGELARGKDPCTSAFWLWISCLRDIIFLMGSFFFGLALLMAFSYWLIRKGNDYDLISNLSVEDTTWFKFFSHCDKY